MVIKIHLDADADAYALLNALRHRGVDVSSSREKKLLEVSDDEQLAWTYREGRVLYTYNACDFYRLHTEFLRTGRRHAGIIIGEQQLLSVGEECRRLLTIADRRSAKQMESALEFLNNWANVAGR